MYSEINETRQNWFTTHVKVINNVLNVLKSCYPKQAITQYWNNDPWYIRRVYAHVQIKHRNIKLRAYESKQIDIKIWLCMAMHNPRKCTSALTVIRFNQGWYSLKKIERYWGPWALRNHSGILNTELYCARWDPSAPNLICRVTCFQ